MDVHFRDAAKIMLVCDNLNTHKPFVVKAFPPDEARRIAEKIEFHYTPKHGSWQTWRRLNSPCCLGNVFQGG